MINTLLVLGFSALVIIGILVYFNLSKEVNHKGTATNEIVKQKLLDASDLVTQKLIDYGTVYYDNQGIPVLT